MINIPAICDQCGTIFPSSFVAENAFDITLNRNKSGPCPKCGDMGHLPDGTFNFVNDTIQILQAPERTVAELKELREMLIKAKKRSAGIDGIKGVFLSQPGELKTIVDFLPKNRTDLYAFITIIIMFIGLLLSISQKQKTSSQKIEINTVINNIYLSK